MPTTGDLTVLAGAAKSDFDGSGDVVVGRSRECDVTVDDPYVSRRHGVPHYRDGRWTYVPEGKHGSYVGGTAVSQLHSGRTTVTFGPTVTPGWTSR